MNKTSTNASEANLVTALGADDESTRLKAALAAGSNADPGLVDTLVARCAIEPDFRDARAWPAITRSLLCDSDDNVAQSAWRAAVVLVPDDQKSGLAVELAAQLGRGDRGTQLSLSRALISLGEAVIEPVLQRARASDDLGVRAHADATERLLRDPNAGFQHAINQVKRILAPN